MFIVVERYNVMQLVEKMARCKYDDVVAVVERLRDGQACINMWLLYI